MSFAVQKLSEGIGSAAKNAGIQVQQNRVGTMFATFFNNAPVIDWDSAKVSDTEKFGRFFQTMLSEGIYIAPSQFEAGFISTVHDEDTIAATINAAEIAMKS